MDNKTILASLASDLKRITIGLQRKSMRMANRFQEEVLKRKTEVDVNKLDSYMHRVLNRMELSLKNKNAERKAEDALMYSTLIQNYVLYK